MLTTQPQSQDKFGFQEHSVEILCLGRQRLFHEKNALYISVMTLVDISSSSIGQSMGAANRLAMFSSSPTKRGASCRIAWDRMNLI